jgi:TetR/AcrR family transcriptional regulator, repressor of fatR-cypB operon
MNIHSCPKPAPVDMSVILVSASSKAERILDAALSAFDELGYGETPMPEIARRAQVAVGSIYRYFPSKEALVNVLYRREKRRFADALFAGVDLGGPPKAVFDAVWQRLGEFAEQSLTSLCFLELHHHETYLDSESLALGALVDQTVGELFTSWQRVGALRAGDPLLLLAQVFGCFAGAVRFYETTGRPITAALADLTSESAWCLLAQPKESMND